MPGYVDKIDELDERSEPVQEILGTPPIWTIRWGISVILLFIFVLLGFSWLIKFPDIIPASIIITTSNPPIPIVSQTSGKLDQLLIKEGHVVEANQLLASLENPASTGEVLRLERWLLEKGDSLFDPNLKPFAFKTPTPELGELQLSYSTFDQRRREFQFEQLTDPVQKEIASTQLQLKALRKLLEKAKRKGKAL